MSNPILLKPLVKQPGGKRRVASLIVNHIVEQIGKFNGYHEPMFGAGAVFCELYNSKLIKGRVTLADNQSAICNLLKDVKSNWNPIYHRINRFLDLYRINPLDTYYDTRNFWNEGYRDSARFIFLKQTAFNGLWRENLKGGMNAPWGKYKNPKIPSLEQFESWHKALKRVVIKYQEFDDIVVRARKGDLVYFDPPYWGAFDKFSAKGFSTDDQLRLMKLCLSLMKKGVHVVYSNIDSSEVYDQLEAVWLRKAPRRSVVEVFSFSDIRAISGHAKARKAKKELLVIGRA